MAYPEVRDDATITSCEGQEGRWRRLHRSVGCVGRTASCRRCPERQLRSGFLCAEAGQGLPPFPAPLSPLAAFILLCAPDRFLLDEAERFLHNRDASVATRRWCSGSSRNAVRLPFGTSVQLRRNPHRFRAALLDATLKSLIR